MTKLSKKKKERQIVWYENTKQNKSRLNEALKLYSPTTSYSAERFIGRVVSSPAAVELFSERSSLLTTTGSKVGAVAEVPRGHRGFEKNPGVNEIEGPGIPSGI